MHNIRSTVAIIGGGAAGLTSLKAALESGLSPTLLEKCSRIGGLWKPESSQGAVWQGMQTNLSKFSCMFSDFPWDKTTQLFPTEREVHQYFLNYIKHFNLTEHIHCNAKVVSVEKSDEKWRVEWEETFEMMKMSLTTPKVEVFDYVIIASGFFSKAYIPSIPGISTFKGQRLHSKDFKRPSTFENKRVAVIGSAFSGTEIASTLAKSAKKVVHCFRRSCYVIPKILKTSNKDLPLDLACYSRKTSKQSKAVSEEEINRNKHLMLQQMTEQGAIHKDLAIAVDDTPPFVTFSNDYLREVEQEKILLHRGEMIEIDKDSLIFSDDTKIPVDDIIFCTGYQTDLSFLSEEILNCIDYRSQDQLQPFLLYHCTFHPDLPGMAWVGQYRAPFFSTMELQARWATQIFSGNAPNPSREVMLEGLQQAKEIRDKNPRPQFPYPNYVQFTDEIAKQIGVRPPFKELKTENFPLYKELKEGPFLPVHFRLYGPNSNPEVAQEVMEEVKNILK